MPTNPNAVPAPATMVYLLRQDTDSSNATTVYATRDGAERALAKALSDLDVLTPEEIAALIQKHRAGADAIYIGAGAVWIESAPIFSASPGPGFAIVPLDVLRSLIDAADFGADERDGDAEAFRRDGEDGEREKAARDARAWRATVRRALRIERAASPRKPRRNIEASEHARA